MVDELKEVLKNNNDKRVCVLATTCTGKSTLCREITGAVDMDEIIFPLLSRKEKEYVCDEVWTKEIGGFMSRVTRERVFVEIGKPVFGTVLLDCDLIIYLKISDGLLRERTGLRGVDFKNAKKMQEMIECEIAKSGVNCLKFFVG